MKADSTPLSGILTPAYRYVIPLFQRDYVWSKPDWENLWDDIIELRELKQQQPHFMGAIVFAAEQSVPNKMPTYQVIDGQQRLITLSILLCAIRDVARENGFSNLTGDIDSNYLMHSYKEGEEHYRVYPRWRDRDQYIAAVGHKIVPGETIRTALEYFSSQIKSSFQAEDENDLRVLFNILCNRLQFVQVNLSPEENQFQIFRSLNSTGVDLAESDLIRNYMFMKVPSHEQSHFDKQFWEPLEKHFESKDAKEKGKLDGKAFSAFLRDFLMHKGTYVGVNNTFIQFERYCAGKANTAAVIEELEDYVQLYDFIRGQKRYPDNVSKINEALAQLRNLQASTAYPVVLNLLHQVKSGTLSVQDATHAIKLLSGFILRRYVCNYTSRTYGKWFVSACACLKESPLENLRDFLVSKDYPNDADFQNAFVTLSMYNGNYDLVMLKAIEQSLPDKEPADLSKASIEHIMPKKLTKDWIPTVGEQDGPIHKKWLHTPGNLTITNYNGELGQKSFLEKRKIYKESHFKITKSLYQPTLLLWNAAQIEGRGKWMAEIAKGIWIGPNA